MSSSKVFASGVVLALAAIGFVPGQLASGTTPPPPPTIVLPAVGATVSGQNVILDATAPAGTTSVEYGIFQWDGMSHAPLLRPVAYALIPTEYGWIAYWNTTGVPNGSYDLWADATVNGTSDSTPVTTFDHQHHRGQPPAVSEHWHPEWSHPERNRKPERQCARWRNRVVPLDRAERDDLSRRKLGFRKWWLLPIQSFVELHDRAQRLLLSGGRRRILRWSVQCHQRRRSGEQLVSVVTAPG